VTMKILIVRAGVDGFARSSPEARYLWHLGNRSFLRSPVYPVVGSLKARYKGLCSRSTAVFF
jgi:hypothetical protein